MNYLIDSGLISELNCGSNYSFILNDAFYFSETDYKILQSNSTGPFVKCVKLMLNGSIQLFYLIDGLRPFSSFFSTMNADSLITSIGSVIYSVIKIRSNGFFRIENLDFSFDHIYVDQATGNIYLLYLPLTKGFYPDAVTAENALRSALMQLIYEMGSLASPKTIQLYDELKNISFSLEKIYDSISSIPERSAGDSLRQKKLSIKMLNYAERISFDIDKSPYIIGRSRHKVDGFVGENLKTVSRIHCKITQLSGDYFVEDIHSAGGTYLNKVKLRQNKPEKLKDGDILILANIEFLVRIQ